MSSKLEVADPSNALTWPENSPAIAVDVSLGKLGKYIDVDLGVINELLDTQNLGEDRSGLLIVLRSQKTMTEKRHAGSYIHIPHVVEKSLYNRIPEEMRHLYQVPKQMLEISLTQKRRLREKLREPDLIQNTALHELRHFMQDMSDTFMTDQQEEAVRKKLSRQVAVGILAVDSVASTGIGIASFATGANPAVAAAEAGIFFLVSSAFAPLLGSMSSDFRIYKRRTHEIDARSFAEKIKPIVKPIITVS